MSGHDYTLSYNKAFEVQARNGRTYGFEQVGIEREFRLRRAFARLLPVSDATTIRAIRTLRTERRIRELLVHRPSDHVVWGVVDPDVADTYLGFGLYGGAARDGRVAAHVVVDPAVRGIGLGRLLLETLLLTALVHGVSALEMRISPANRAARSLLSGLDASVRSHKPWQLVYTISLGTAPRTLHSPSRQAVCS